MNATSVRRNRASAPSDRAYRSSPAKSTWPAVGRSSPPRRWSSVDLPTPDAPINATLSAGLTLRFTPRRTFTVSGPTRYSFSRFCATRRLSLIAEHVDGIEAGGSPRGREGGEEGDDERRAGDEAEVDPGELHGQMVDLVHVAGEVDDLVGVLHPDECEPEEAARHGSDHADEHARDEKDAADAPRAGPHGLQDADLLALLGHEQHQVPDDGKARHEHDDGDDDEERELLELERVEEVAIHAHPVSHPQSGAGDHDDAAPHGLRVEGIVELHLDAGDLIAEPCELLGRLQRRVRERGIVLVESHLDVARDLEAPHLGHETDRRHCALRGDHRHHVTWHEAERAGQLAPEQERGVSRVAQERVEATCLDLGGKLRADRGRGEIDAAEEATRRAPPLARKERLLDDEWRCRFHPGDFPHLGGDLGGVRHALAAGVEEQDVGVGGDDPLLDAVLEARHYREHHDESAHAEENAAHPDPHEEGEIRPLAARPEVAQGEEELEGRAPSTHAPVGCRSASRSSPPSSPSSATPAWPGVRRSRRRWGKRITSRMEAESVKSMVRRSMPMPSPAVGGMPYSRARTKSSSIQCASSSPRRRSCACSSKRRRWSMGSLSSEYALAISRRLMKSSKRSTSRGSLVLRFDSGESSMGKSVTKVGWISVGSTRVSKMSF